MRGHSGSGQLEAWLLTIWELFAADHWKPPINPDELPGSKKRFPRKRGGGFKTPAIV
uniref:RxLR effector candidate protein n=1 Tax=Hyaloperonospora arabidopsidis (strain Emoy2) TaxID=559515 RepID=M4BHT0_HYAAE